MKNFKLVDTVAGWTTFAIATISYLLTIEPTASYWDCGEFICTAFRQEVGHPPGAPLFMILGRFFALFAGDDVEKVSVMINSMSALASGFTVLFLYWSIVHIARRIFGSNTKDNGNELSTTQGISVIGSGIVGALAFAYTDTFWFSAVEGEVYAMSSLFTAVVFWCILKWESVSDEKYSNRWLILICYLMGLSIGVHLLNLLAIPAIVFVYYFKKYKPDTKGVLKALALSVVILAGILYGIIPGVVYFASLFELVFTNGMGAPYNTGTIIYVILVVGALVYGLYYSYNKRKVVLNTVLLGVAVIIIGYSSFAMIVIRSAANPPMDENNPDNVFALRSYLNREQYGDRPLLTGEYFNSEVIGSEKGSPTYIQRNGRYEVADYKTSNIYAPGSTTVFPRMYSPDPNHVKGYKYWGDIDDLSVKPTFLQNLKFFFGYQIGYMYLRYFMWNFVGRQNDIQGHDGSLINGNWISGIPFIDNARLGDQELLSDPMKQNKGNNKYYFLPLLLGIFGMVYMWKAGIKGRQYFWIVMMFFVLTGVAIVVYLNQTPYQPRERDYAYAGSFYAFAFYIGFGVAYLCKLAHKYMPGKVIVAAVAVVLALFGGPVILASENWDDHDRSGRYTARDFAIDYLESCAPNAILFTNGDNDTFPLWYAQEVEGIRTDVRVVNLAYINTDWYINQMRRKAYNSAPLPISISKEKLVPGTRELIYYNDMPSAFFDEKYQSNYDKYSPTTDSIYNKLVDLVKVSKVSQLKPDDYDAIVNKQLIKNDVVKIAQITTTLASQADKYGIDAALISALKLSADNLIKSVSKEPVPLKTIIDFVDSDDKATKATTRSGESVDFVPTLNFMLPVDKAKIIANGIVPLEDTAKIVDKIVWRHPHGYIRKGELMVLDILANNNWERPVYFAITVGQEAFQGLDAYFRLDGFAYRIVPIKTDPQNEERGDVNTSVLYDSYINKFVWGGINNPNVYLDENNLRMLMNVKSGFHRLASTLFKEGNKEKAVAVIDKCYAEMPIDLIAPSYFDIYLSDLYYKTGNADKAEPVLTMYARNLAQDMTYFTSLTESQFAQVGEEDIYRNVALAHEVVKVLRDNKASELAKEWAAKYASALKNLPLLSKVTINDIESQDFYKLYTTLSDFEKQLVQIYFFMLDERF
jgi:hypothetical protein